MNQNIHISKNKHSRMSATVFNPEFSFDLIDDSSAANTLGRSLGENKKSTNKAGSKKLNSKESQLSLPEEVASKEGFEKKKI